MKKVILNKSYGGFGVSKKAYELYAKKKGLEVYSYQLDFFDDEYGRKHTRLVRTDYPISIFAQYSTRDLGEVVDSISEEDKLDLDTNMRDDETLIEVVEELGKDANGRFSDLVIVEIPDDVAEDYVIDDYDGIETLHKRVTVW